jgi:BirA family transcriptional regulator, biotin operon repressor / biotin---[acetyl-CoA-carboxylase] ligase
VIPMGDLDEELLRASLRPAGDAPAGDRDVAVHAEIDSTSDELKRRLARGEAAPGSLVVAATQTCGRGRQGRTWFSPAEGHLYASLAVGVEGPPAERVPFVPLAAGVAAIDALQESGLSGIILKWPNDLLRAGRKVGGILCEAVALGSGAAIVVIGLGINTGRSRFVGDLAATAGSLGDRAGGTRPEIVTGAWVRALEGWVARLSCGDGAAIAAAWTARAEPFGRRVRAGGVEGTTVGLDARGLLLIRTGAGDVAAIAGGVVEDAV